MSNLWDAQTAVPPNPTAIGGDTLPQVFWNAVALRGERVFMRRKLLGIWESWRWRDCAAAVREIAMGLAALGLKPGDCASILSNTLLEWVLADLAIQSAGGVTNGVYPTDSASQLQYLCEDSRTVLLFVEDEEQLDKALEVRSALPLLRKTIVFDTRGLQRFSDPDVMSLDELRALGREFDAADPGLFDERLHSRGPADLAILVYTSGTTGKPKGAMHSHAGLVYSMRQAVVGLPQDERDERMCFLPLCHIAERLVGAYASLYSGATLNFVENPDTVAENVREIAPTIFFAVPRVWEKFYSAVAIAIKEASPLQQLAYRWALGVGGEVVDLVLAGKPVGAGLKLRFLLARGLALNNVRKLIGIHRCRALLTGAAPISPELIRWYLSLGVPMLEGWAQTESCALGTITRADAMRPGTIGVAAEGVEVRVDEASGELLLRGPNVFMGYLNQPEKTAETIDAEGWLHTGDVGAVDADGYFRITDRMKDIIITAGGKNITPSELENELKFSPFITDAVVIGDKRAYLTALVMIDQENVEKFAQDRDVPFSNYASLTRAREVQELIEGEIAKVNRKFARVEQIKQFRLLETQLGAEDEELTPTMKLKRSFVQKKYASLIESMYSAGA
ncbi:AMP-dependent synthetase/ligase [Roseateles violae]|uniref:Long-chain fatty acid--CoA ligase n=1 Tax=Roseateles violae TaxID=3058042 RepID=A0ABT8DWQ7_9BURK|nr:long-chain fatty acid--CoA ligase [Pelomonas sp. PFR6]MDN3920671.1 long-chain fatty acid--CoA ligase [Pelomonas sp. PFR6]